LKRIEELFNQEYGNLQKAKNKSIAIFETYNSISAK